MADVARASGGDGDAVELSRQMASLRALATGILRGDEHLAEDVVQEASLAAIEQAPRNPLALRAWLRRSVANRALNTLRARTRRSYHERSASEERASLTRDEIDLGLRVQQSVLERVRALPELYREVVWLRYWESLPPGAIAQRLQVPEATVRTRLRRALARLRERLEEEPPEGRRDWSLILFWPLAGPRPSAVVPVCEASSRLMTAPAGWLAVTVLLGVGVSLAAWLTGPREAGPQVQPLAVARSVPDPADESPPPASAARIPLRAPSAEARTLGALSVRVRHADGTAGAGVALLLRRPDAAFPDSVVRTARTDVDGIARFADLVAGAVSVQALRGARVGGSVEPGVTRELALGLERGTDVSGRVTDDGGAPIAGATLWLTCTGIDWWRSAPVGRSGADGAYRLRDLDASNGVRATAPGHRPSRVLALRAREPQPGGGDRMDFALERAAGHLRGRIVDSTGRPVPNAEVAADVWSLNDAGTVIPRRSPPILLTTDEDGAFRSESLGTGRVNLTVRGVGHPIWRGSVVLTSEEPVELAVELPEASVLQGTVLDFDGSPVAGALVVAEMRLPFPSPFPLPATHTDAAGHYRLEPLPAGDAEVRVHGRVGGARCNATRSLSVAAGGSYRWDVTLDPADSIVGTVIDEQGVPVVGVLVRGVNEEDGARSQCSTDEEGRFALGGLAKADYALRVSVGVGPGLVEGPRARLDGVRAGGAPVRLIVDRSLLPSAFVSGRFLDEIGAVPAGERVFASAEERTTGASQVALVENGRFRIGPLAPGSYRVRVGARRVLAVGSWLELRPNDDVDVGTLEAREAGSVAIRFRTAAPSEGAVVAHLDHEEYSIVRYLDWDGGGLGAEGLLPGHYDLTLMAAPFALVKESVRVVAGERTTLDVELRRGAPCRFLLESSDPWRRARVTIRGTLDDEVYEHLVVGADPELVVYLPAGPYDFRAETEAGLVAAGRFDVGSVEGDERRFAFPLE